jgi:hypothetical protein
LDQDIDHILAGGGQTGDLLRALDWSTSPLGPPSTWPQPLKTLLNIVMGSNQPMFIAWGEASTLLYNDAYAGSSPRNIQPPSVSPSSRSGLK